MKTQMNTKLIDAILVAVRRGREVRKQKNANNSVKLGWENELLAGNVSAQAQKIASEHDDLIINHRVRAGGEL